MFDPGKINSAAFEYYPRLRRVKDYVNRDVSDDLSLRRLAGVAGLDSRYFSSYFHTRTGVRFKDWVTYLRVREAMAALRVRNRSITEVAFAVGFNDLRTFERAFKRCVDMTPRDFKRTVAPRGRLKKRR